MQIPCPNRIRVDDESPRRTLTRVVHGRIYRVGIALLTAAALAAALAPCAQARGPRLGLVTAAYLMGDPGPTLSDARRAGARWTREDVAWYRVQPFPGVWDWRATDRLMPPPRTARSTCCRCCSARRAGRRPAARGS